VYSHALTIARRPGLGKDGVTASYVSLKDVATLAGVSVQTASKVLNGKRPRVAAATEARIHDAARELGYYPNRIAQSLLGQSTMTIGLVAGSLADPALAMFAVGAEREARRQGHSVLVGNLSDDGDNGVEVVRSLIERRVDGIVAAAPQLEEDIDVAELLVRYVPSVSLHHVPGGGVPLVGSNHREVGRMAVTHLLERGRLVIGTVAGPFRRRVVRSRLRGAEEPIHKAGAEVNEDLVVEADWTAAGASVATSLLLQREPQIDAIFVHSDLMAIGVLEAVAANGRRVPDDVAVVSCDDLPFAAHLVPGLTTVRVPFAETGARAVSLLLALAAGEDIGPGPVLLPVELVVRGSTAPPPEAPRRGRASSPPEVGTGRPRKRAAKLVGARNS
jgi:LacI family transcriptional regulator